MTTRSSKSDPKATVTCPACEQTFLIEGARAMPFCSSRCRLTDLGRWLDEAQGLPIESEHEEPDWNTSGE